MGFFKTLFGGKEETSEQKEEQKEQYNFEVLTYDAMQALHIGKTDYAIACLERALDIRDDEETRYRLALAYSQKDDLEAAADEYHTLADMAPDNAAYPLAEADLWFQLEQYDKMKEACLRALAINAGLASPHYLLAKLAKVQDDLPTALDHLNQALAVKEDFHEARLLRAEVLKNLNRLDEADADVDLLMEAAGENVSDDVLLLKAQVMAAIGKTDDAIAFYRQAINLNPFLPVAYLELSSLYRKTGRGSDADAVIAEAVEQLGVSPEDAEQLQQGEGLDMEEYMRNAYNVLNPYQLSVKL
ncbi:MAG: tetratricopeptide repeat protein [Bacteroidales bacterium]|nr:tetratricopeptide repeat protein [Bacteroidales bacterium]